MLFVPISHSLQQERGSVEVQQRDWKSTTEEGIIMLSLTIWALGTILVDFEESKRTRKPFANEIGSARSSRFTLEKVTLIPALGPEWKTTSYLVPAAMLVILNRAVGSDGV